VSFCRQNAVYDTTTTTTTTTTTDDDDDDDDDDDVSDRAYNIGLLETNQTGGNYPVGLPREPPAAYCLVDNTGYG